MSSHVRSTRRLAAVATLVLLVGDLIGLVHESRVRHVRCAAHGELVETVEVTAHSTDATRLVAVDGGDPADLHCALAGTLGQRAVESGARALVASVHRLDVPRRTLPARRSSARIFRIAPKTSPPAHSRAMQG